MDPESQRLRIASLEAEVEALKASQRSSPYGAELEGIIDGAPLAIYLKDSSLRYLLVNREYERLAGRKRAEILGRDDFELFPEPVARLFREQDLEIVARASPTEFRERIPLPDGVHSFITAKFPLRSEGGGISGVAGVCTEITALEHAQESLATAQAEMQKRERLAWLGELSAAIAHEVRNPLAVVFNALSSLRRLEPGDAVRVDLLRIIEEEADRLNRMVGSLLELARPAVVRLRPSAIQSLLEAAIEAARALTDPAAEVKVHDPVPARPAQVDAQLLHQALVNLLANAIEAPQRRGPVGVKVSLEGPPGNALRFEVVDDGAGVPVELTERIFAPFFTTRARGTGLGLAMVRRAAEAHGGAVTVEQTVGGGATFVLRVPAGGEVLA